MTHDDGRVEALPPHHRERVVTLSTPLSAAGPRKRAPAAAKYRHPENAALTWTGRGRKPRWVTDHLAKGGALDALAI